jgi:hypothetical protein
MLVLKQLLPFFKVRCSIDLSKAVLTQHCADQMSLSQMTIGQMSNGQMSDGQMSDG